MMTAARAAEAAVVAGAIKAGAAVKAEGVAVKAVVAFVAAKSAACALRKLI